MDRHRGVWVAPWMGEHGELVLFAMKRDRRLLEPPLTVPAGADGIAVSEALWSRLDAADPPAQRSAIARPRFARVARTRGGIRFEVVS